METTRTCKHCNETKDITQFHFTDKNKIYRRHTCDKCRSKRNLYLTQINPRRNEKRKEYMKTYMKGKYKYDPMYKIYQKVKYQLYKMLKDPDFKQQIEDKFENGMTWDNYSILWELDHIIPVFIILKKGINDIKTINHILNIRPRLISQNRTGRNKQIIIN